MDCAIVQIPLVPILQTGNSNDSIVYGYIILCQTDQTRVTEYMSLFGI